MIKYILGGGNQGQHLEKEKAFHAEMVKGLENSPIILVCYFAQPRETWEKRFQFYQERSREVYPQAISPNLSLAMPDMFEKQLLGADVLYITGGDDILLLQYLKQFDLQRLCKGKVVVGSSAGGNALATSFWTCDWRMCKNGLGLLPIKFISHYESTYGNDDVRGPIHWQSAYNELEQYGEALPIYMLQEGDFTVIEKE